ncbi:hypothetical protein QBC43DRAFT_312884 [Cladorrhinum sp. PSN259]|nr:hypothetical protein QBC43DRAFT_312884 [Cladorrhinum sp. PSN259]
MAKDNSNKKDKNNKKRPYSRFADPPPFRTVWGLTNPDQRDTTPFRNAPPVFLQDNLDRKSVTPPANDRPPPFLPPPITNRFNSPNLVPSQQFCKPPAFKPQPPAIKSPSLLSRGEFPPLSTQQVDNLAASLLNPEQPVPDSANTAATPSKTMPPPLQPPTSLASQLQTALQASSTPLPSIAWLTALSTARNPPPPLASLLATARARILASDLTTPNLLDPTYASTHCFPPNLHNPYTESCYLPVDTIVQVLDIENLSKSRWEQVEELESLSRGESKRGREIIRVVNDDDDDGDANGVDRGQTQGTQFPTQQGQHQQQGQQAQRGEQQQQQQQANQKNATHKLLFQDPKGQKIYGIEVRRVEKIGVGVVGGMTCIGEKMLLKKGMTVARGVLMLEPAKLVVLGGKVEVWNKAWTEARLERLKGEAAGGNGQ